MIDFSCPTCGKSWKVADDHAGKVGKCKSCNTVIKIPTPILAILNTPEIPIVGSEPPKEIEHYDVSRPAPVNDGVPRNHEGYIDWYGTWCPNCRNRCSKKEMKGAGCLFAGFVFVSMGLALILLPFLPREWHCLQCQNRWRA